MLEGFLALPIWLIVLISISVPLVVVIPVVKLILSARIRPEGDDTEGLVAVFGFIGTVFALLLAFVIVNVWSDQVSAQNTLFDETATLKFVIEEAQTFDPKLTPIMKGLTLNYLDAVSKYEVDTRAPSGGDPRAEAAFRKIIDAFKFLKQSLEGNDDLASEAAVVVDQAKQLIFNRADRVSRASGSLNGMTTLICVILALLTVLSMALLPAPSRRWVKWVQSLGVATAVGLVMSLVFYMSSDAYSQKVEHEQIDLLEQMFDKPALK
ncbi:MAG: DUF4239 domain-containing protein [Ilumatobacteraceae bacterium]|nr:DUF4239 domain-containing protein [Ilumatobacteraceae bacterium]